MRKIYPEQRAKFHDSRTHTLSNLKFQINDDLYGATAPFRRYQHLTFFALLSCIARKNSALLSGISSG